MINIHHVDLALQYADRIIGIQAGKIVFDGPTSEYKKNEKANFRKIYGRDISEDDLMKEKL